MRVTIKFDSADTVQVRQMAVALHRAGLTGELKVGVEGPECWGGETPPLRPDQFATVVANLVKHDGELLAEVLRAVPDSQVAIMNGALNG